MLRVRVFACSRAGSRVPDPGERVREAERGGALGSREPRAHTLRVGRRGGQLHKLREGARLTRVHEHLLEGEGALLPHTRKQVRGLAQTIRWNWKHTFLLFCFLMTCSSAPLLLCSSAPLFSLQSSVFITLLYIFSILLTGHFLSSLCSLLFIY